MGVWLVGVLACALVTASTSVFGSANAWAAAPVANHLPGHAQATVALDGSYTVSTGNSDLEYQLGDTTTFAPVDGCPQKTASWQWTGTNHVTVHYSAPMILGVRWNDDFVPNYGYQGYDPVSAALDASETVNCYGATNYTGAILGQETATDTFTITKPAVSPTSPANISWGAFGERGLTALTSPPLIQVLAPASASLVQTVNTGNGPQTTATAPAYQSGNLRGIEIDPDSVLSSLGGGTPWHVSWGFNLWALAGTSTVATPAKYAPEGVTDVGKTSPALTLTPVEPTRTAWKAGLVKLATSLQGKAITQLRTTGKYRAPYTASDPGRLSVSWYLQPSAKKGARGASPRLVASSSDYFYVPLKGWAFVRLAPGARALLSHLRQGELLARASFAPVTVPRIAISREFRPRK